MGTKHSSQFSGDTVLLVVHPWFNKGVPRHIKIRVQDDAILHGIVSKYNFEYAIVVEEQYNAPLLNDLPIIVVRVSGRTDFLPGS